MDILIQKHRLLYMNMHTKDGLHFCPIYTEHTSIRARVANKQ